MHTNSNKPLKLEAGAKVCIDYANSLISHHDHPPADEAANDCAEEIMAHSKRLFGVGRLIGEKT